MVPVGYSVPCVLDVQHVEKKHDYENETCPVMAGDTVDFCCFRGVYINAGASFATILIKR